MHILTSLITWKFAILRGAGKVFLVYFVLANAADIFWWYGMLWELSVYIMYDHTLGEVVNVGHSYLIVIICMSAVYRNKYITDYWWAGVVEHLGLYQVFAKLWITLRLFGVSRSCDCRRALMFFPKVCSFQTISLRAQGKNDACRPKLWCMNGRLLTVQQKGGEGNSAKIQPLVLVWWSGGGPYVNKMEWRG